MESLLIQAISKYLQIPFQSKGSHHPDTVAFWRSVQVITENPHNILKQKLHADQYRLVKKMAHTGANRYPSSSSGTQFVTIHTTENPLNGYDT